MLLLHIGRVHGCVVALCTFAPVFGQTATPPNRCVSSDPRDASQLARQYVTERMPVWRHRLKLDGWQISVVPVRRDDLKPKALGGIKWDKPKKTAVIWVLDPADYQLPFCEMLDDMELTIVHELVHLELASLPRKEASRSSEETAVNGIADALLALDRRRPGGR